MRVTVIIVNQDKKGNIMELAKKTSLQNQDQETKDTLDWKLQQLTSKNLPIESGLADYIAFGMSGIENDITQLTNYKALIEAQIKKAKENQSKVKIECAEWLQGQGLEKLNGLNVSSVTITKATKLKEEPIEKTTFKTIFNNDEDMEKYLIEQGMATYAKTAEWKVTPAKPSQIKVNNKRK